MSVPELPELTFPEEVRSFVRSEYERARIILEYGSGGSTFLAAGHEGRKIVSVESDPAWAERMRQIAESRDLPSKPRIIYADVGPVIAWARPASLEHLDRFSEYWQRVWDDWVGEHPDLVLVDGRFRAACFMATYLSTEKSVRVLFDDYRDRKQYHVVERLCRPSKKVGRMAAFDIKPQDRRSVAPWLLVATFFDAATSFSVGPGRRRTKLREYPAFLARHLVNWFRPAPIPPAPDACRPLRRSAQLPRDGRRRRRPA